MTVVVVVCRETFEQQRMDIRALQREFNSNKKALEPKVRKILAVYIVHVGSVLKQSSGTCTLPCNGGVYHYHWQEWKLMALASCRAKSAWHSTIIVVMDIAAYCTLCLQERMLSKQERDIQSIQSQLAALQAELGTELLSQLNQDEQEEVCWFDVMNRIASLSYMYYLSCFVYCVLCTRAFCCGHIM